MIFSTACIALVSCGLLLLSPHAASAQITNTGTFGSGGSGDGQFSSPGGVAVVQSTGNVYVVDTGNFRVEKFNSSGNFIAAWGWGVSDGLSKSEVCKSSCQTGIQGSGAGQFNDPVQIAVDNDPSSPSYTDVYVADEGNNAIEKFNSSGKYLSSITGPNGGSFNTVFNVATDTSGNVWAYDEGANVDEFDSSGNTVQSWNTNSGAGQPFTVDDNDNVYAARGFPATEKFTSTGKDLGELDPNNENASALGADLSNHVYSAQQSFVAIYSATAKPPTSPVATFGQGILSFAAGIAANSTTKVVYVSDAPNDDVQIFQLPSGPPSVDSESVANVTSTDAVLNAQVDPNFSDTKVHFQYGTTTSYGKTVPVPPRDIGSGVTDVPLSAPIKGLTPNTTYHFQVVAKNSAGTTLGPDRTFKTYPSSTSTGLPENRAYEQVTPPNKDNADPYLRGGVFAGMQAAPGGNAFAFISLEGFPNTKAFGPSYLAQRKTHSWVTQSMIPPQSTQAGLLCGAVEDILDYSTDLSTSMLADGGNQAFGCGHDQPRLVNGEPKGVQNLFVRNNTNLTYKLVSLNPVAGPPADANWDASSSSLSHVIFDESAQLTSDAPSGDDLYDWSAGAVKLVTEVPPSGTSCTGGTCSPTVGSIAGGGFANASHAVSSDGSRIYFTADNNLYLRQNGTRTVQVDAPASGAPGPGGGGIFAAASADGSKVFFTDDSSAGLTSDTQAGSGTNLYEYNASTGKLTNLTPTKGIQVQGVSVVSSDGSYVYYVALGKRAAGATKGQPNLYVQHSGATKFIATLSTANGNGFTNDNCNWQTSNLCARVSSNGQFLAFTSLQSLTGYNNTDPSSDSPDQEIFLYNASANKLVCASCNPSGAAPTGNTSIDAPEETGVSLNIAQNMLQHYVSDSGQVFYDTPDQVLPADTNSARDVYEYEANGTGSCKSSAENGGCEYMLSGGTETHDSLFVDATPSGSNAFFSTAQQLLPLDTDGAFDIYDARIHGGFPAPIPPPPPCVGESCKPAPKPPPPLPAIATITFHGPGHAPTVKEATYPVKGRRFAVSVRVPAKGRITASGTQVKTVRREVAQAGTYKLTLALTYKVVRAVQRTGATKVTVRIVYARAGGRARAVTLVVWLKR